MTAYFIVTYVASLALAYVLAFTRSTLLMGRELSDAGTATGYQDAITPPRFSTIAMVVYASCLGLLIFGIWQFGWLVGLGSALGLFIAAGINQALLLPKPSSGHFRNLILHSMMNRHADYLKSGDALRASVMADLLRKAGLPVTEFSARQQKGSDTP